jgi:hypothetical protein
VVPYLAGRSTTGLVESAGTNEIHEMTTTAGRQDG